MNTLQIENIALVLEGLEEEIISKLINRIQFCRNDIIYQEGKSGFQHEEHRSLFELRLYYQEHMDAQFGRFCIPEERPFSTQLPPPKRHVNVNAQVLKIDNYNHVNLCNKILKSYSRLCEWMCTPGDDAQHGSSVEHDVYALQAIARRIHYGSFYVAESKYRVDSTEYDRLIDEGNRDAIEQKLTRADVEGKILNRVHDKVSGIQHGVNTKIRRTIDPDIVLAYYRDHLIPMTKEGEILYLMHRIR